MSKKSGVLYKEGGVGSSPAKGWFKNLVKKVKGGAKKALDPLGIAGKAKTALGVGGDDSAGGGDTAELEARVSALEEGGSGGGGDGQSAFAPKDPKKLAAMAANLGGGTGLGGTGLGGISAPFEGWKGV